MSTARPYRRARTPAVWAVAGLVALPALADQATEGCPPNPTIEISDASVVEGDSGFALAVFEVSISAHCDTVIDFATRDGTATVAGNDYEPQSGSLFFPQGNAAVQTIQVGVGGDTEVELDEDFFVDIQFVPPSSEGAIVLDPEGRGVIVNDDGLPTVSIGDASVVEGDTGSVQAVFTLSLSATQPQEVTVGFATANGSAAAGPDYQAVSGTASFPPGSLQQTLQVPVFGDTVAESDETFTVNLSNPMRAVLGAAQGVGTIVNDDAATTVRISSAPDVGEGDGEAVIDVGREGSTAGSVEVTVTTTGGTATPGEDFEPISSTLTWGDGESGIRTVSVPLLDDNREEGDETILVTLSDPVGASLGAPASSELTILDDDRAEALELVGDGDRTGRIGRAAELSVRVTDADGRPIAGAVVEWTVEGDATLSEGDTTQTDIEGVSSQEALLGDVPGIVRVRAELAATGDAVEFEITAEGDLRDLFDSSVSPGQLSVAEVLDTSCAVAEGGFADLCDYVFGLEDAQQAAVVDEATPHEVAAQGRLALDVAQVFLRSVGSRLAALRGGATRGAVDQLALTVGGEPVPLATLATAFDRSSTGSEWARLAVNRALHSYDEEAAVPLGVDSIPRLGFFASGRLAFGDRDGTAREAGFEADIAGLLAGLDYRLRDDLVIGGALGVLDTDADLDADGGGLEATGWSVVGYGSWFRDALWLEGALSWGSSSYDLERHVDLPVPFLGASRYSAVADTDSDQLGLALAAGWDRAFGGLTVSTSGRLSWIDADIDGYRERGAGPFDLDVSDQSLDSLLSELGVDLSWALSRNWGVLLPSVRGAYLHEFGDDSRLVRGNFVQDVLAQDFVVPTDSPDRDFFNLGVGITAVTTGGRSYYVFYDTDLERDDLEVGTLTFGLRLELGG